MPIHGARAVLVLVCAGSPVPPALMLDNLLSKVIAAGLAAGVFLLVVARPPALQWSAVAGAARTGVDPRVRDPRPQLRPARADGDPRADAPARRRPRPSGAQPPGRRARAGPRSGAVMLAFTGLLLPGSCSCTAGTSGRPARRAPHAGGAQGGRAQGRAREDGRRPRGRRPGTRAVRGNRRRRSGSEGRRQVAGEEDRRDETGQTGHQARREADHHRRRRPRRRRPCRSGDAAEPGRAGGCPRPTLRRRPTFPPTASPSALRRTSVFPRQDVAGPTFVARGAATRRSASARGWRRRPRRARRPAGGAGSRASRSATSSR